jgi:selenide, water dikinase
MAEEKIRLTSFCAAAGCAAKMGPAALAEVLRPLARLFPEGSRPELLVGLEAGDDAAVYQVDDSRALVFTADFFPPVLDDPYDYGAVAAANALSDIYAMGGEPAIALNLAGFPAVLPPAVTSEIIRGGAEKAAEAGCIVVGGHTITSQEPLYGLAVVGFVHPGKLFVKTALHAGDMLVLTKPLGVGVLTTALKRGTISAEEIAPAIASMKRLNREAARVLSGLGVSACTDVTGFSILGHALELARKSGVGIRVDAPGLRWLPGALAAGESGAFPNGTKNNTAAFKDMVCFGGSVSELTRKLLFSPETSGGLLAAVPREKAPSCLAALQAAGAQAFIVGEALSRLPAGTISVE